MDIGSTNGDVWYPVYDGHGNMVATLSKSGSGYNVSNRRSYDPWGNLRLGSIYTEPNGRYCANLGHKTDDESAMIYMRARYYEPSVGRFISEDPARDGVNWFTYCSNEPVNSGDRDGRSDLSVGWCAFAAFMITFLYLCGKNKDIGKAFVCGIISAAAAAAIAIGTNALGRHAEMSLLATAGSKFLGGGFVNMIAQLMIDLIVGDTPGGDLVLAFLAGGAGPFLPSHGNVYDAGQGCIVGGGVQALYDAASSMLGGG